MPGIVVHHGRNAHFARARLEKERAAATEPPKGTAAPMRAELDSKQRERRSALDHARKDLFDQHRTEREALDAAQDSEDKGIFSARLRAQPKGVIAFIARITGIRMIVAHRQKKQDQTRAREHAEQREALKRRHARETLEFQHRYRGLGAVEKRERHSLQTALRRDQFRMIAGHRATPVREPVKQGQQPQQPSALTAEQRARLETIRRAGLDLTTAETGKRSPDSRIAGAFEDAAANRPAAEQQEGGGGKAPEADRLQQIIRTAEEITAQPEDTPGDKSKTGGVRQTFNKAATKDKDRARDEPGRSREDRRRRQRRFPGPVWDREW